jgi:hypothetical protein
MSGDKEFASELNTYLADLDDPASEGFAAALHQSYFDVVPGSPITVAIPDDVGVSAAGYSWGVSAPWSAADRP